MDEQKQPAAAGPVERPVRPLVDRLCDAVQGLSLGADGMGWSPDSESLMDEAATELLRLRAQLEVSTRGLRHCAGWNISDNKRAALMSVVLESEALLSARPNVGGEARLAAHQPSHTTTATPQGVASTDQLGGRVRSEKD